MATREAGPNLQNIRVSHFVMPFVGCTPVSKSVNGKLDGFRASYLVPCDDTRTCRYFLQFKRSEPVTEEEFEGFSVQLGPEYTLAANQQNDYLIDREKQRKVNFTGLEGIETQDACMVETAGAISDRTKEHLGFSDRYVIAIRRFILESAKSFQEGKEPPGVVKPGAEDYSREIDCTDVTVPVEGAA